MDLWNVCTCLPYESAVRCSSLVVSVVFYFTLTARSAASPRPCTRGTSTAVGIDGRGTSLPPSWTELRLRGRQLWLAYLCCVTVGAGVDSVYNYRRGRRCVSNAFWLSLLRLHALVSLLAHACPVVLRVEPWI